MKFKKDGSGKILTLADAMFNAFECHHCPGWEKCEFGRVGAVNSPSCIDYAKAHPAEDARLMGYEVVEEERDECKQTCITCENYLGEYKCKPPFLNRAVIVNPNECCEVYTPKEANMDNQSTTSQVNQPEPVNYGSSKPLKDWTLGEVKEYCGIRLGYCDDCPFIQHTCMVSDKDCPHEWDLSEKPRFTEEEVAFAKAMYAVLPEGVLMRNAENKLSWDVPGLGMEAWRDNRLPYEMFPSILAGQSVRLSDIVGGDTE